MSESDRARQRIADIAFVQRWRNQKCHPGGASFAVVEELLADLRQHPLIEPVDEPKGAEPKARVRAEVIVGILEEILLAKALDAGQEPDAPLALAGHIISKLKALGVDLS